MDQRTPIQLFDDVPGGETAHESHKFDHDGTIERLWARNYIGHEFDLRYRFEVESKDGRTRSLINHLSKSFITGDDDEHEYNLREPVEAGETVHIYAENTEPEYLYHANTYLSVDYENGGGSFLGGVF